MHLPPPFEFDDWRAEPDRNALISRDGETRLGSRVMSVLALLAGSGGRVVPRDELLTTVWEGRAVTDDALTVAIHDLRKTLGDRASDPRFVETIPGRGYRWLVPVREVPDRELHDHEVPPPEEPPLEVAREASSPTGATVPESTEEPSPIDAPAERPRILRWLAARAWRLGIAGLAVVVAGALAFGWRAESGRNHVPEPPATVRVDVGSINPEVPQAAVDAFFRGGDAALEMTPEGYRRAAIQFEKAAELAPDFALAHAHLADALLNLSFFPGPQRAELSNRARVAAEEALALDPTLPGAYLVRGILRMFLDWNLAGAEQDFWRAIQLQADYAPAHERYAWVLVAQGRFAAAEVRLRYALDLLPTHERYAMQLGRLLLLAGRPEEALEALAPRDAWRPPMLHHGWLYRARALDLLGREAEACAADLLFLEYALPELDMEPYRRACDEGGLPMLHELWLETLEEESNLYLRAAFSLELGRADEALAWLRQMHDERDPMLLWLATDPWFHALADHPGLEELLRSRVPFDPDDPPSVQASTHPAWAVAAR